MAGTTIQIGGGQSTVMESTTYTQTVAAKKKKKTVENWHQRAKRVIQYTQGYAHFDIRDFKIPQFQVQVQVRSYTRLHGKAVKLKIHRVTPGAICTKMKGLFCVSYAISEHRLKWAENIFLADLIAFFLFSYNMQTNMSLTQKSKKPCLLLSKILIKKST